MTCFFCSLNRDPPLVIAAQRAAKGEFAKAVPRAEGRDWAGRVQSCLARDRVGKTELPSRVY
jgi:hypothetical protein